MSAAIPQGMLEALRTTFDTSLPRTCTVPGTTTTVTNTGDGGWDESTGTGTTGVKCSFMAAAGNERLIGGAIAEIGNYIVTFEQGVSLSPRMAVVLDALEVDGVEVEPTRTFQLVAPLDEAQMIGQRWLATEG